jgi:hypothetical protein
MKEEILKEITTAVQTMTEIAARMDSRYGEIGTRIERIVAAVESEEQLQLRIVELEKANRELQEKLSSHPSPKPGEEWGTHGTNRGTRKTLPSIAAALLAKSGVETDGSIEAAALDAALTSLPVEQRIAVKSQMAKAGMII